MGQTCYNKYQSTNNSNLQIATNIQRFSLVFIRRLVSFVYWRIYFMNDIIGTINKLRREIDEQNRQLRERGLAFRQAQDELERFKQEVEMKDVELRKMEIDIRKLEGEQQRNKVALRRFQDELEAEERDKAPRRVSL